MVLGFTLMSTRAIMKIPVKMVAQLQGQLSLSNGHSQPNVMIKFLPKCSLFCTTASQQSSRTV